MIVNKMRIFHRKPKGMTLIELMVVVAIISILVTIMIPIYLEYTTRTKVGEGMAFLGSARTNITETWRSAGCGDATCLPINNSQAGMGIPTAYATDKITSMTVTANGVVTIVFSMSNLGTDNALEFVPTISGNALLWDCNIPAANGIKSDFAPPICR